MPQKIIHRKVARTVRKRAAGRKNKKGVRCQGSNRAGKADTGIIANSFFALTLKQKPAIEVKQKQQVPRRNGDEDYNKMYEDILKVVQHAVWLVKKEKTSFNPLKNGFDLSESFGMILNMFRNEVLPAGWSFNIELEEHNNEYYINIHKVCEMQAFWHCFEIKPPALWLQKHDPALHDMFILFMYNFYEDTNILTWWNGGMGYVDEDYMLERLDEYEGEYENAEEFEKLKAEVTQTVMNYKEGIVFQYLSLLRSQEFLSTDKLRAKLSNFSKRNKLVKWMYAACDFMDIPATINDFVYPDQFDNEGLQYDQQASIIWDCGDRLTQEHEEGLDAEANGCGIIDPILNFHFRKSTKEIDLTRINDQVRWPQELTKIFHQYNEAIKPYERKN